MHRYILPLGLALTGCTGGASPDVAPIALTPGEYNRSVLDLLAFPDDPGAWPNAPAVASRLAPGGEVQNAFSGQTSVPVWPWAFPDEVGVHGFDGMVEGQSPSAYQIEELQKAALHFGSYALVSDRFWTCGDWEQLPASEQQSCAQDSLTRFAQRAWRRPLTEAEQARLDAFWLANIAEGTVDEAVALTAAGILQSPAFVYRIELGKDVKRDKGRVPLTDWEMASRLSYFLWDSIPDEELFRAATQGELTQPKGIEEQVSRMLDDPRARTAVVRFHQLWLETDNVHKIAPAQQAYGPAFGLAENPELDTTDDGVWPAVTGVLRASMEAETHLFIEKTLFEGAGTLEALLSDNHGYLSDITEPVYGSDYTELDLPETQITTTYIAASLPGQQTLTLRAAAFPENERAGLLTLPAVLALGAHPVHPSPILRGKRILERVLCTELGTPPPGAEAERPPDTVEAQSTNRQRVEEATSPPACAGCHEVLNPPGFAFESYDSLGRFRDLDNGQPVDSSGQFSLPNTEPLSFSSGVDLARQLAVHDTVRDCYALRWSEVALGVELDPTDPDVQDILSDFRSDDRVLELLNTIATSDLFRYRALGGTQ